MAAVTRDELGRAAALIAAVVAAGVTYGLMAAHPWPHVPLAQFLGLLADENALVRPALIVWYVAAALVVVMVWWPVTASGPVVGALLGADFAWVGAGYFAWLRPDMHLSWAWTAAFLVQAGLVVLAAVGTRDLVIRRPEPVAGLVGALLVGGALVGYPLIGVLGGHPLGVLPLFGLAPCPTVLFFFGVLLWASPPVPTSLLPIPLAWALTAAPPDLAQGVTADHAMLVGALLATVMVLWRDRDRVPTWQTVVPGLVLAVMVVCSGHDDIELLLAAVALVLALVARRLCEPDRRRVVVHGGWSSRAGTAAPEG